MWLLWETKFTGLAFGYEVVAGDHGFFDSESSGAGIPSLVIIESAGRSRIDLP